jgi:hypothetical protein
VNLYGFVGNDGIDWIDVLGTEKRCVDAGFYFKGWKTSDFNNEIDEEDRVSQNGCFQQMAGGNHKNVAGGEGGKDLINHLKSLSKDNCGIKILRISGHGGPRGLGSSLEGSEGFYLDKNGSSAQFVWNSGVVRGLGPRRGQAGGRHKRRAFGDWRIPFGDLYRPPA